MRLFIDQFSISTGSEKTTFSNAYATMESVGLQYGSDEFVEGSVNDGRYASPKSGALYAPENFYDAASGSWYSSSGGGGGGGSMDHKHRAVITV